MSPTVPFQRQLDDATVSADARLIRDLGDARVRCVACGHRCLVPSGHRGVCKVRYNEDGSLRVPWGYVSGLAVDPIEKKPFFHVLPGAAAVSFGMLGCDLHCSYCQNWMSSQALRDESAVSRISGIRPDEIVEVARRHGSPVIVSTYNEPLITAEWSRAILRAGHEAGLYGAFVSNGNATPEVLDYLRPFVQLYKVDLKGMDDGRYRQLGGVLDNVLRSIDDLLERDYWVEIVTLLVPGLNDADEELGEIARFLASRSRSIPWHVTGFSPDYRMTGTPSTPVATLDRARRIGLAEGLQYVYTGNRPGAIPGGEDTLCPSCAAVVIRRRGFIIVEKRLGDGRCPDCRTPIPGIWEPLAR